MSTRFKNREHAAALLSDLLVKYRHEHPLVLGVARGGVPMARVIADEIGGDLDVVVVRKLRAAFDPEFAVGAVDESGVLLGREHRDPETITDRYVRDEIRLQSAALRDQCDCYAAVRQAQSPDGRIVILVDDSVATGSSLLAAIRFVRLKHPRKVVIAVAVASRDALIRLEAEADEIVCLHQIESAFAVGQAFEDFAEVSDEMVVGALTARQPRSAT